MEKRDCNQDVENHQDNFSISYIVFSLHIWLFYFSLFFLNIMEDLIW